MVDPQLEPTAEQSRSDGSSGSWWGRVRQVPLKAWASSVMHFYLNVLRSLWEAFFPIYSLGIGLSIGTIGLLRGLDNFVGIFSRALTGKIGKRFDEHGLTHMAIASAVILVIFQSYLVGALLIGLTVLLLSVARAMATVSAGVGVMRSSDRKDSGASGVGIAVYSVLKDIGNIMGPIIGGFVAGPLGVGLMLRYTSLVLLVCYALSMVGFAVADRRKVAGA